MYIIFGYFDYWLFIYIYHYIFALTDKIEAVVHLNRIVTNIT
jgi:hypothetical protein